MSYARMVEAEEKLRAEIQEYLRKAQEIDEQEDSLFGKDNAGPNIPEELKRRETRIAKIREAKAALEAEQKAAQEAKEAERKAKQDETGRPPRGPKPDADRPPKPKAQRNFTDPDSRIMKAGTGNFVQGYNAQAAVDSDCQVIVACELTNQAADVVHFEPMLEQTANNTGERPHHVSADAGYFSKENATSSVCPGAELFIPPDRMKHSSRGVTPAPADGVAACDLSAADKMRRKLSTETGRAAYAWRKKTVEPVFGQIKGCAGSPGFRQIMRRGLVKAKEEWRWACATHNFLKYFGHHCASAGAP
jgi:hypothetical protein